MYFFSWISQIREFRSYFYTSGNRKSNNIIPRRCLYLVDITLQRAGEKHSLHGHDTCTCTLYFINFFWNGNWLETFTSVYTLGSYLFMLTRRGTLLAFNIGIRNPHHVQTFLYSITSIQLNWKSTKKSFFFFVLIFDWDSNCLWDHRIIFQANMYCHAMLVFTKSNQSVPHIFKCIIPKEIFITYFR